MRSKFLQAMDMLTEERYFRLRLFGEGILVGAFAGAVISLFRFLLEKGEELRLVVYAFLRANGAVAVAGWLGVSAMAAAALWRIVFAEPLCTGSGIPQLKGILLGKMKMRWWRVILAKLVGGVLAIGMGLSLGREGPSVQLGSCAGQGVAAMRGLSRTEERFLLIAGAGAGLAAAFNAPLAGVIFCLEELTKTFSPFVLMATVAASVTATTLSQLIFGGAPVFHMGELPVLPPDHFGGLIALGIFTGLLGQAFNKFLMLSLNGYEKLPIHGTAKFLLPLLAAVPIGFFLPEIMGGGNRLVDSLVVNDYALGALLVFMAGKFFFTMLSFGSGVPGGIFLPMLVMGALTGSVFSKLAVSLGLLDPVWAVDYIVFAMAAYFAAVVKSPITGSILIMEMTGSFQHMLPLIIVSLTAVLVSEALKGEPVYEMLLARSLSRDKEIKKALHRRRLVAELTVGEGSALAGKAIAEVNWPPDTLIVNVRRGEAEYVPDGRLILQAEDYLYIYADAENIKAIEELAEERAEE